MNSIHFIRNLDVAVSAETLAEWHEKPGAFGRIQPPWEKAKIVNKAKAIEDDLEEHIQIQMGPVKKMWIARYHNVIKGKQFCDFQVKGPFGYWDHRHIFRDNDDKGSRLVDEITYREPMGFLGRFLAGNMIYNKLDRMFRYRHEVTRLDLERHHQSSVKSKKILIAGGSGLVGSALEPLLKTLGHSVYILTRKPLTENHIKWNPEKGEIDREKLHGFDAVINLAGRNVAAPWTKKIKKELTDSRLKSTELLVKTFSELEQKPEVFISSSGSSVYPLYDGIEYDESGPMGEGFLPNLARSWEEKTAPLEKAGIRRVVLRIGIVLSPAGGAMKKMMTPFLFGLGGPFGKGDQYMSWIALDDLIDIIAFAIGDKRYSGVINAVSPQPVTNKEFCKTLAKVLHRPCFMKVPSFVLKAIPGGMGKEIFLASNRVKPGKLLESKYQFRYSDLEQTFCHLLGLQSPLA